MVTQHHASSISKRSAEVQDTCRSARYLQKCKILAEVQDTCRSARYLHKCKILAQVQDTCTSARYLHKCKILAQVQDTCIMQAACLNGMQKCKIQFTQYSKAQPIILPERQNVSNILVAKLHLLSVACF